MAPGGDQLHDGTGEIESASTDAPASATDGTDAGAEDDISGLAAVADADGFAVESSAEAEPAEAAPVQSAAATPIAPVRLVDTVRPVRVPPGPPPLPPEVSPFPAPPRLDEFLASRDAAGEATDATAGTTESTGAGWAESVSPEVTAIGADGGAPVDGAVEGDGVLDFLADFAPAEPSGVESLISDVVDASSVATPGPMTESGVEHPVVAEAEAVVGAGLVDDLFDDEDDSLSIHSLLFGGDADGPGPGPDAAGPNVLDTPASFDAVPDTITESDPHLSPGMTAAVPEPHAEAVPVVEVEPEPEPVVAAAPVAPVVEVEPEPVAADAAAPQQVAAAGEPELEDDEAEDEADGSETVAASASARPARAGSAARPARPGAARQAPLVKGGPEFKDIFKMAMNGNSLADSVQVKYDAGSERGRVTSGSPPADDDSKRRRRRKR